jgi:hypothetical protein
MHMSQTYQNAALREHKTLWPARPLRSNSRSKNMQLCTPTDTGCRCDAAHRARGFNGTARRMVLIPAVRLYVWHVEQDTQLPYMCVYPMSGCTGAAAGRGWHRALGSTPQAHLLPCQLAYCHPFNMIEAPPRNSPTSHSACLHPASATLPPHAPSRLPGSQHSCPSVCAHSVM